MGIVKHRVYFVLEKHYINITLLSYLIQQTSALSQLGLSKKPQIKMAASQDDSIHQSKHSRANSDDGNF